MSTKIKIKLTAEREDETPEYSEKITGSAKGYALAVRKMMKKSEGLWGWCSARVEVTVSNKQRKGLGVAYLGNCSYLSAEDFVKNSGYFNDMVNDALSEALKNCDSN